MLKLKFIQVLRLASHTLVLNLLLIGGLHAQSNEVNVPIAIDYPLMRELLESQLFEGHDHTQELLADPSGCNQIELSDPRIGPRGDTLEIVTRVKARLGLNVFQDCRELLSWEGDAGFLGLPVIQAGGRSVKLEPKGVWLDDPEAGEIGSGPLWEAVVAGMEDLFGGFVLDLAPYTDSLEQILPELLPYQTARQLHAMAEGITVTEAKVLPDSLDAQINFSVDASAEPPEATGPLSEMELEQLEQRWQMMDALLVSAVKHYAAATALEDLRSALLDILIDSRYRLRDALIEPASRSDDEVRRWFIESWQNLAPVVRKVALEQNGQEHLLWLSLLTATDALYALDKLGPSIGFEISTDGLRRLARMINAGDAEDLLRYGNEVDPELRELWQRQIEIQRKAEPSAWHFLLSVIPQAHAAASEKSLNMWAPRQSELDVYLPRIADLLSGSATRAVEEQALADNYRDLFQDLVLATAWQESCWRQYVVKDQKIVPLRSSSGDVGLMQINERVWRGFYDIQKLRWDIDYNSHAGAEVLMNYLVKYALKKGEQNQPGGLTNLARASYSAYNGGPRQISRYRESDVPVSHQKVDALFWEKYQQVTDGQELNVASCLGG